MDQNRPYLGTVCWRWRRAGRRRRVSDRGSDAWLRKSDLDLWKVDASHPPVRIRSQIRISDRRLIGAPIMWLFSRSAASGASCRRRGEPPTCCKLPETKDRFCIRPVVQRMSRQEMMSSQRCSTRNVTWNPQSNSNYSAARFRFSTSCCVFLKS